LNNEDNRTPVSQASRPWISSVAIAKVIENFAAKQVPFCWWTSNSTQPADLGKYLEAQGLSRGI